MRFRGSVRILAGDKLESLELLRGPGMAGGEPVVGGKDLIQADRGRIRVDALRGVGVEGARVDVGAVGGSAG